MANLDDDFKATQPENIPTVFAADDFDAEADAQVLRTAMKGFGTDEDTIIKIVSSRSTEQLKEIAAKFKTCFGRELIHDLKSELKGNVEETVIGRFLSLPELHATYLRKAMKGFGTKEEALVEILCTKTNKEILELKETYQSMFERDLEEDVVSEVGGDLEKILFSVLQGTRSEPEVDDDLAQKEANELYEAGEGQLGTTESTFNKVFALRSFPQLRATFAAYKEQTGGGINSAITKEFSGTTEKAFLTIYFMATNPLTCYTRMFRDSMKDFGTDDCTLIRLVLSHCEVDLLTVRGRYQALYGEELYDKVKDETSGDYEKILISLLDNATE